VDVQSMSMERVEGPYMQFGVTDFKIDYEDNLVHYVCNCNQR